MTLAAPSAGDLTIWFDGQALPARTGDSVAVALLAAGIVITRARSMSGMSRGFYCMMGACFECLAVVDGRANVQTCMIRVLDGMRIQHQEGVRQVGTA